MAKSLDLFFILLGSFIFIYHGNDVIYVKDLSEAVTVQGAVAVQNLVTLPDGEEAARQELQSIYSNEIGVREETNQNDGKRIVEYLNYTGLSEGYAWCAAFVSSCFKEAGYREPKTAWSPSLFPSKRIIWKRNGGAVMRNGKSKLPKKGDVFGIYFTNLKRIAHAGFVDEWGDTYVITVEGNTNEGNSRDGDGVYRKRRPLSSIYQVADWINSK